MYTLVFMNVEAFLISQFVSCPCRLDKTTTKWEKTENVIRKHALNLIIAVNE